MLGAVTLCLVLAACGGKSKPTDYNAEVERTFINTCTDQSGNDLRSVCQCAYNSFKRDIPFDRFQRVDQRLADNPESALPDDFLNLYTDCVVQAGGGAAGTTPTMPPTSVPPTTAATGGPAATATTAPA